MIEINDQEKIVKIIDMFFPHAKIHLFGSYARGDARRGSDIDIAIDNGTRLPLLEKSQVRSMIEVINLIQNVDLSDFQVLPADLQKTILNEGLLWKG